MSFSHDGPAKGQLASLQARVSRLRSRISDVSLGMSPSDRRSSEKDQSLIMSRPGDSSARLARIVDRSRPLLSESSPKSLTNDLSPLSLWEPRAYTPPPSLAQIRTADDSPSAEASARLGAAVAEISRLRNALQQNLSEQNSFHLTVLSLKKEMEKRGERISQISANLRRSEARIPELEALLIEREHELEILKKKKIPGLHTVNVSPFIVSPPETAYKSTNTPQPTVFSKSLQTAEIPKEENLEILPEWAAEEMAVAQEIRERLERCVHAILIKTGKAVAAGIVTLRNVRHVFSDSKGSQINVNEPHFLCIFVKHIDLFREPDDAEPVVRLTVAGLKGRVKTPELDLVMSDQRQAVTIACGTTEKLEKWLTALKGLKVSFSFSDA